MPYTVSYLPAVARDDIPAIPVNLRRRIEQAIRLRLGEHPEKYGTPLRGPHRGLWKLRVGTYRVVYRVVGSVVHVLIIGHRGTVYETLRSRWVVHEGQSPYSKSPGRRAR